MFCDEARFVEVSFRSVDRRIGCRIDHDIGSFRLYDSFNPRGILQIHFVPIEDNEIAERGQRALKFPAYLAAAAEQEDFHEGFRK
jgi:hypothetical protein